MRSRREAEQAAKAAADRNRRWRRQQRRGERRTGGAAAEDLTSRAKAQHKHKVFGRLARRPTGFFIKYNWAPCKAPNSISRPKGYQMQS